ncbi:MAG: histone deacetylase family protein [bacterium]|nr:MAG: histone deacetylase family protein [bacterium]
MFRIRRIHDITTPFNRMALDQVKEILRVQFPGLSASEIESVERQLMDPLKYRFRAVLLVAEDSRQRVRGFALLLHAPDLKFAYLEYISAAPGKTGGGIGGVLYERTREEARDLGTVGIFCECLPDDPALSPDPEVRRQNEARLKFYERYGARPIAGTAYETPLSPGDDNPPYLVFDDLGSGQPLPRDQARVIVRAILDRKYGDRCPPGYIDMVVESFRDDPVRLRAPRYVRAGEQSPPPRAVIRERRIALVKNDNHDLHHVRERGYVQSPVRIASILREILPTGLFEEVRAHHFSEDHIRRVHDGAFVDYLKKACSMVAPGRSIYPYVFPIRNVARPPRELPLRAGYYCIDTFTPLNGSALKAALGAVDCALTGAQAVQEGYRCAYVLVRPPGHHAERRSFGGFCYFNSAAIAADELSRSGKVAVLDIDYHHGNGTQDIFYRRADVLTVSIHGTPRLTYPYFSGFEEERGEGTGLGTNRNFPMPEGTDGTAYAEVLGKALGVVKRFGPRFLVVALGLDTAKGDPTGSFLLAARDFTANGRMIGSLGLPTLVVQEGGYRTRSLGASARSFFTGLWEGLGKV